MGSHYTIAMKQSLGQMRQLMCYSLACEQEGPVKVNTRDASLMCIYDPLRCFASRSQGVLAWLLV